MNRKLVINAAAASALVVTLFSTSAGAQKNYTDGGDLYGGAHSATKGKQAPAKQVKDQGASRTGKFDPYTEGARTKGNLAPAQKFPDERPQPDDVAKAGKFDPYTDGRNKK
ncbi:hypothetical protein SAMN05216345_11760 [Cupriavidus sp. YR651]|uniref:hypothetical protein n=1 Tax=Cupriavidus sp. YR651 TaxID=1855315 RepID=UPI000887D06A|nr:hypothetical protein [Cupriavidus sp. YR651]SDD82458.1 hypothetical protein SAMN05216345_11760 [Cupriavidus sp. YR651]